MPQISEQSLQNLSLEEMQDLKKQMLAHNAKQKPSMLGNVGRGMLTGLQTSLQDLPYTLRGKVPSERRSSTDEMNEFIAKEKMKRILEGDPMDLERKKLELKAEMEAQDPYKQSQTKLNEAMLESIRGASGGDLVYRDTLTGEEVPKEMAISDISQGNNHYKVFRRTASRQGVKEDPVTEPQIMTSEGAGLVGALPSMEGSIDKILNFVEMPGFKWGAMGDVRAATGNPYLVGGQLEEIQSELNNLKKTAFAEGGKQLTGTEKQIVFRALEPGGKDINTWIGELKRAKEVMRNKARLMVKSPQMLNKGGATTEDNDPLGLR